MNKNNSNSKNRELAYNGIGSGGGGGGKGFTIKTMTYVGTGEGTNVITFSDTPQLILEIVGRAPDGNWIRTGVVIPFMDHKGACDGVFGIGEFESYGGHAGSVYEVNTANNTLIFKRDDDIGAAFNGEGSEYTIYYI